MTDRRRGDRAQYWIERNCQIAFGKRRGSPAKLTMAQRLAISKAFNNSDWAALSSCKDLAPYLALLHVAGPERVEVDGPALQVDLFSILNSAAPRLRSSLQRRGETVVFVAERRREDRRA